MASSQVPIILGTATIGDPSSSIASIKTPELAQELVSVFRKHGHTLIDSARVYPVEAEGSSEAYLGKTDMATWATVDTKVFSNPGDHAPEIIAQSVSNSLKALGIPKLRTIYLHYPDRTVSLEGAVKAINIALERGQASQWGISNYTISEIEKILSICKSNSIPFPAIYQGHYNAIARKSEDALLPLLRANNIAYYAYSPAAGGSFSKSSWRTDSESTAGEFHRSQYGAEKVQAAIDSVRAAAENYIDHDDPATEIEFSGHAIALRWTLFHSAISAEHGDAVIIGASSPAQLEKTLKACEAGPLPEEIAKMVDDVWEFAREGAPEYTPFMLDELPPQLKDLKTSKA